MRQIIDELDRVRRISRLFLLLQRSAVIVAWVLGTAIVLVLLDYALRLPSGMRLIALLGGIAALAVGVGRYLSAAISFRPSLTQLALRAEESLPAVSGRLASSVEFAMSGADRSNPLAARSVREAERRLEGHAIGSVIRPHRTVRDIAIMAGMILVFTLGAMASPGDLARIGLSRLFLPYGSARWPARTAVESLMAEVLVRDDVHPRGQVLALRARNLTPGDEQGRVDAYYRLQRDGAFDDWTAVVLTHQAGGVHERLVDTNADAIDVYFETEDARTETRRIALIAPPAILGAALEVTPPAYASGRVPKLVAALGPGLDERAVTPRSSLIGSHVDLRLELNKPIPGRDDDAWIRRTFGWGGEGEDEANEGSDDGGLPDFVRVEDDLWRISWSLRGTRTLSVELVDEYGLTNSEPITYRINAAPDVAPAVTITEPQTDIAVLSTALVALAGEARDDVAVVRIALVAAVDRTDADEPEKLEFAAERDGDAQSVGIEAEIDLARFDLNEGDVVLVAAVADDAYEMNGTRHESARSTERRLRIISGLEFAAQIRRELSSVRQNAIRMESLQGEIQDDVIEDGVQPGLKEAQAQLGDRIAVQGGLINELREQQERNRLDDDQLSELLQQSRDLLDYAGRAANRAVEAIEQGDNETSDPSDREDAGDAEKDGNKDDENEAAEDAKENEAAEKDRPLVDAQQDVRDELADLIELLDRDEDTWIVQRQLESLLETQRELLEATESLAQETIGRDLQDLTPVEQSALDQIVQRQRELPDQARRLIEEMRRRAEALEEIDPQAASGMRKAADTGEEREVDRDMEAAADRAGQNQLQSAGARQQAASASLERMIQDLDEPRRARAQELIRELASLTESIQRLIVVQEGELIALGRALERDDYSGRDRAMIRLSQNTRAVAVEARGMSQQARRIARALDRAADAQGATVLLLRGHPIDADATREAEERSLELLKEAKKLTEELQEETQAEQTRKAREELIAAYRSLAEKQIAVRAEAVALDEREELTRRELVELRKLGNAQQEIRNGLNDVQAQTHEVLDSPVFSFVHKLMDQWSSDVSDALWEGTVDVTVTDHQQMIAESIARQIEALEESVTPPEDFEQAQDAGPGGGGGGMPTPLIPPVAEVKRLHGLQEQVYDQTRNIDGRTDLAPAQRRQRVRELGQMQRDIMELGEEMLEKLQGGGAPRGVPIKLDDIKDDDIKLDHDPDGPESDGTPEEDQP